MTHAMAESVIDGLAPGPLAGPRSASVEEGYERWAASYDQTPNPLLALEERCLLPLVPSIAGKHVLDLACGTGRWLQKLLALAPAFGLGIDLSGAMLARAREKAPIAGRLTRADCRTVPCRSAAFDLAICSFALGHMGNLRELAAEWSRVLQEPADLYISDLHPSAYAAGWRTGFRDEQGAMQIETMPLSKKEIATAFTGAGFAFSQALDCFIGEPERPLFARAGKHQSFDAVRLVPAVMILHFRYGSPAGENAENQDSRLSGENQ